MSRLTVYPEDDPTTVLLDTADGDAIAAALDTIGVRFERWEAAAALPPDAGEAAVLAAYAPEIERLRAAGYGTVDVARISPDHPDRAAIRARFLAEHRHDEDEVRFFVSGAGLFCLREAARVHLVLCEAGDLISVPAHIRHWFDTGAYPHFTAIRFFRTPEGWVGRFTGDPIADAFPRYERA